MYNNTKEENKRRTLLFNILKKKIADIFFFHHRKRNTILPTKCQLYIYIEREREMFAILKCDQSLVVSNVTLNLNSLSLK